jgi:hypothetical protein
VCVCVCVCVCVTVAMMQVVFVHMEQACDDACVGLGATLIPEHLLDRYQLEQTRCIIEPGLGRCKRTELTRPT